MGKLYIMGLITMILFGNVLFLLCCGYANSSPANSPGVFAQSTPAAMEWKKASFLGIRIGEDHTSVALRVLGSPVSSGEPEDQSEIRPELWDEFRLQDDLHARVTVISSKTDGMIIMVISHPTNLSLARATEIFGKDFKNTNYSFAPCTEKDGDGALQVSENGPYRFIEYPSQGIAITLNSAGDLVRDIEYRSEPVGFTTSPCQ